MLCSLLLRLGLAFPQSFLLFNSRRENKCFLILLFILARVLLRPWAFRFYIIFHEKPLSLLELPGLLVGRFISFLTIFFSIEDFLVTIITSFFFLFGFIFFDFNFKSPFI